MTNAPFRFDPAAYPPAVAVLAAPRLMALGPGTPNRTAADALAGFNPLRDLGPIRDQDAARACHAGLWLLHDFLDESHTLSQAIDTPEGSAWHAIMHRREPDAWNSGYWWRRVGPHPVAKQLAAYAPALGYAYSTPEKFVSFCEEVRGTGATDEDVARHVQQLEWQLLFDHCYRRATG